MSLAVVVFPGSNRELDTQPGIDAGRPNATPAKRVAREVFAAG